MMFLLLVLIFVVSLPKAAGSFRRRQAERSFKRLTAALAAQETIPATAAVETRQDKEFTRALKAAAKEQEQAEKRRQQVEQAQADKQFFIEQLNKVNNMIISVDDELKRINQAIKHDVDGQYYDSELKDRKRKEQILRKLTALENRQHMLETKLAKAEYIIRRAG